VLGATPKDWNHATFWYEPWGKSGVHKGIDIFGKKKRMLLHRLMGLLCLAVSLKEAVR